MLARQRPHEAGATVLRAGQPEGAALLQWSHHHGGSGYDRPGLNSLAVDGSNNLIVVGETQSTNMTTMSAGGFYMPTNSNTAGFIARYASGSHALQWSSYVSGASENVLESVTVAGDKIFTAGYAEDCNFPVQGFGNLYHQDAINPPIPSTIQGGIDGIVRGFSGNTSLGYSTYFGGDQGYFGDRIYTTAFRADRLYLGGTTSKNLDPLSYFPLDDAGGPPAYFDESYDPAPTNFLDGFLTAICTENFVSVVERLASTGGAFNIQPTEGGLWVALGLEQGNTCSACMMPRVHWCCKALRTVMGSAPALSPCQRLPPAPTCAWPGASRPNAQPSST
ncbi:MAG: hypothetical protein ACK4L7_03610 [Flavobacteriales bacterium]